MRLTLRTLLAWMDDTLSAQEVREIGKQMSESPYARELAEKINKVARQRRLTVPNETGPEASDANHVSAYLDNELGPDEVTAYEKLCLTSDVNLAEVASVHQILSLIGQKAKVPPEVRHRMYRLVKGREATTSQRTARTFAPSHDEIEAKKIRPPAAPPTPGWGGADAPRKSIAERFGPTLAVLGLIGVLVFAAMQSLREETSRPKRSREPVAAAEAPIEKAKHEPAAKIPTEDELKAAEKAKADAQAKLVADEEAARRAASVDQTSVKVEKLEGLVLVSSEKDAGWKILAADAEPKAGAKILNATPSWTTLKVGPHLVTLVGVSEVGILSAGEKGLRLELHQGKIVVKNVDLTAPLDIVWRGKSLTATGKSVAAVGLEVRPPALAGTADVPPPSLHICVPDGELNLQYGASITRLTGPSGVTLLASDSFSEHSRGMNPVWLTDVAPSAFDAQISERLAKAIRPNRPMVASLVEAKDDSDKEVRRLSIAALAAIGDASNLVAVINERGEQSTRMEAVAAVRSLLARGGESRKAVRGELERTFGPSAEVAEKLLAGFSTEEAKDEATLVKLVQLLSSPDLGTRAIAIDSLKAITGRDSMEYDPETPEGRGLAAWRELITKKELKKGLIEKTPPPPQPR